MPAAGATRTGVPASQKSAGGSLHCRRARRDELHAALRLILGAHGRPADDAQVLDFLQFALYRGINTEETWIAVVESAASERSGRGGRVVWAVLPIVSPGRTMLLLTPGAAPPGDALAAAGMLLDAVCSRHAARGVHLAQVLLEPADAWARDVCTVRGFRPMAELVYLQTPVRRTYPAPPPLPGFELVTYSPETHAEFARAIAETYRESLDCPGLNGMRDMEDVIAGHKASGDFVPGLWFLFREHVAGAQGEAADAPRARAVLLLSPMPHGDAVELVYLGLTPAARGRRVADWVLRYGLASVAAIGRNRLSLAVDSLNVPALKLYYRHGMQRVTSKLAMMRDLREGVRDQESGVTGKPEARAHS